MKKYLLIICLLYVPFLQAQNSTVKLHESFTAYSEKIENKDFTDAIKTYFADDFIKHLPVESLTGKLLGYISTPNYESTLKNFKIVKISEILKDEDNQYCFIRYTKDQVLTLKEGITVAHAKRIKDFHKNKHGENYSFNETIKVITCHSTSYFIGVKKGTQHWKFIPYQEKMDPYLGQLIPEKIAKVILLLKVNF